MCLPNGGGNGATAACASSMAVMNGHNEMANQKRKAFQRWLVLRPQQISAMSQSFGGNRAK